MTDAAVVSLILGTLWSPLLYWGIRHKDLASIGVVLYAWFAQLLIAAGHVTLGRALSVPWVLVIVVLLIDRLLKRPEHVMHVAAAQVAEARKMAHDHVADALGKFAQDMAHERLERRRLERLLEQHDIQH